MLRKLTELSIGPIIGAALSFLILPVLAWSFEPEIVGQYIIFMVLANLFTTIIGVELYQSYVREYYEFKNHPALIKACFFPVLVMYSIFIGSLTLFGRNIFESLNIEVGWPALLMLALTVFCNVFIQICSHIVRMNGTAIQYSASQATPKLFLMCALLIVSWLKSDNDFLDLVSLQFSALFASISIYIYLCRHSLARALAIKLDLPQMMSSIKFSVPLLFSGLCLWGLYSVDRLFLARFFDKEEVAIYAMAISFASGVSLFSMVISNIWHPWVYRNLESGRLTPEILCPIIHAITCGSLLIWSLFGCFSWVLPAILPRQYSDIHYLLFIVVSSPLMTLISEFTVVGASAMRRTGFLMMASALSLIVNVVINIVLTPSMGANGCSISLMLAAFVFLIFRTEASARLWKSFPRAKLYVWVSAYMITSLFLAIIKTNIFISSTLWMAILGIMLVSYRKELKILYLKIIVARRKLE